jgi:hypothetical protein
MARAMLEDLASRIFWGLVLANLKHLINAIDVLEVIKRFRLASK